MHNLLHMTGERVLQPFHDPGNQVVAFFNGEIYNWRELQGPEDNFRTDGDVLIQERGSHGVGVLRCAQSSCFPSGFWAPLLRAPLMTS